MAKTKPVEARILPHGVETEQCVLGCVLIVGGMIISESGILNRKK